MRSEEGKTGMNWKVNVTKRCEKERNLVEDFFDKNSVTNLPKS
jgi:hypothetical protein